MVNKVILSLTAIYAVCRWMSCLGGFSLSEDSLKAGAKAHARASAFLDRDPLGKPDSLPAMLAHISDTHYHFPPSTFKTQHTRSAGATWITEVLGLIAHHVGTLHP